MKRNYKISIIISLGVVVLALTISKSSSQKNSSHFELAKTKKIDTNSNKTNIGINRKKLLAIGNTNVKPKTIKISLDLPKSLTGKVLLTFEDKKKLKLFYTDPIRIETAVNHLLNTKEEIKGEYGLNRIKSIDFLEKSLRYRDNSLRPKIVNFIDQFIKISPNSIKYENSQKFFLGDQLEMLEVLAFNYPAEFFRLQEQTSNELLQQMFKLVEHHAKK